MNRQQLEDEDDEICRVCNTYCPEGGGVHAGCKEAIDAAVAAEREKWRELAQRVAHQGNARGLEGLKVLCTISEAGSVVSWEVDRTGGPANVELTGNPRDDHEQ